MYSTPIISPPVVNNSSNITVVIIGLMLLLILVLLYFKLYIDNSVVDGITLNIKDTLSNIFRLNNKSSSKPNKVVSPVIVKKKTEMPNQATSDTT